MNKNKVKGIVKTAYGKIARDNESCGCGCTTDTNKFTKSIGYSEKELRSIPTESNLGLGCGDPTVLAGLKKEEPYLTSVPVPS